ncbi:hypothetical protein FBU30_000608 [Linnemannia zychae]|nr:hypothetical protein FBU30_000608 [Linnemannia zychae]
MNLHLNDILADNSQNILGCAAKIWPTSTATTEYQPNRMMDSGIWSINNTFTDFHYIKWGDMIAHSSYQTSAECHTNLANTGFQGANSTNTNRQTTSERATRLQSQQPTNESTSRLQHTSSVKSTPLETMPTGNGTSNRIISESQSNSSFNTISLLTLTTKTKSQDLRSESVESQPIDIIDTWIGSTREVGTEIQSSKEINTGFQLTNSIRAKILPMCINTVDTTFQSVDTTSQPVDTTSQSVGMHDVDTESLLSPEADNEDPSKSKVDTELSPLNSGNIEIRSTGTIDTKVRPTSGIYEAIWSSADIDTGLQATRPIDTEIPITKVINSKPQTTIDTEALPTPKSINKPRSIDPTKTEIQSTNIIDAKSQLICKTGDKAQSTKKMPLHNPRPEIDGIDFHSAVMEKSDKRYQYDKNIITKSDSASAVYSVAGEFKCYTCKWKGRKYDNPHGWGSKKIAVEIWMSDCRQYQTQIHSQKCSKCMLFVEPSIQVDDYAVKVANVLNGRKGRHSTANAPQRNSSSGEHKSELCNFCMKGKKH